MIPGIPTLEELTTTYKLRMMQFETGEISRTPDIPYREDYDTYEEYVKANIALMKYARHRAKQYLEMFDNAESVDTAKPRPLIQPKPKIETTPKIAEPSVKPDKMLPDIIMSRELLYTLKTITAKEK